MKKTPVNDNEIAPTVVEASREIASHMVRAGASHAASLRDAYGLDNAEKALIGGAVRAAYNLMRSGGRSRDETRRAIDLWLNVIEHFEDENGPEF